MATTIRSVKKLVPNLSEFALRVTKRSVLLDPLHALLIPTFLQNSAPKWFITLPINTLQWLQELHVCKICDDVMKTFKRLHVARTEA